MGHRENREYLLPTPEPLRDYQRQGVSFLVGNQSALLADEMGLGKTVQTITAMRVLIRSGRCSRVLLVVPRALCRNWQQEFKKWAPELLVRVVEGSAENRQAFYYLPIPILVATYEQMRLDSDLLDRDTPFDLVVMDEAQRVKDQATSTSIACRGIPRHRSWALTGTPIENRVEDLVSLFTFLRRNLVGPGMTKADIHSAIKPYFLRRIKQDVLPELPPILVQDLTLELRGQQADAYARAWNTRGSSLRAGRGRVSNVHLLALLTRLKLICNVDLASNESVKLDALRVILENLREPTDKLIVFSQYVRTLEWLKSELSEPEVGIYHGGQTTEEREDTINWFRRSCRPAVLLMSLKAGGVGLNLQEASTVVLFDRWWNPAVEDQAIHRAHRFGRQRPLHVIRYLVCNTVEERIGALLSEKRTLFEDFIEGAESSRIAPLSTAELWRLLGLAPEQRSNRLSHSP